MTQVDELYVQYRKLKKDVTKSDADRNRVLLDYLKRDYDEEQFHHKVYLAVLILGFTTEEAAKQIGCTAFEVIRSIQNSTILIACWCSEQERKYEEQQTRLKYPDSIELNGEEFRITDVRISLNKKELQISLLDTGMYYNESYFFLSDTGWITSEFYGDQKSTYHGTKINDISLLEHPKVQTVLHQK